MSTAAITIALPTIAIGPGVSPMTAKTRIGLRIGSRQEIRMVSMNATMVIGCDQVIVTDRLIRQHYCFHLAHGYTFIIRIIRVFCGLYVFSVDYTCFLWMSLL
jgi:hypothetical protein